LVEVSGFILLRGLSAGSAYFLRIAVELRPEVLELKRDEG